MKKILLALICAAMMLTACVKNLDYGNGNDYQNPVTHAEQVFGVNFSANQDWSTTEYGTSIITVDAPLENITKVQVLVYVNAGDEDGNSLLKLVNEVPCKNNDVIKVGYDIPSNNIGLVAVCKNDKGEIFATQFKANEEVSFVKKSCTRGMRAIVAGHDLPDNPVISRSESSYASTRNYPGFAGETLYMMSDADEVMQIMEVQDYDAFSDVMKSIIFNYLPNGRKYNNLPQIKESGFYNEDCYAITTGDDPIIVSPVYKNDGGYHEVETGDLYYYYFDPNKIEGDDVEYFKTLPKYKAIQLNRSILGDNILKKHHSYALIYWGDGTPVVGETVGSYQFPKGYKIGFMVRLKYKDAVKQGELYFDGRLNNKINKHGHFKSSGLGDNDPRMGWMSVNKKMFMCCEAGTDADFNDVIFEVEGGIEEIIIPPVFNSNFYTFCFEDQLLGDYDLNDIVLKGRRLSETKVEYTLMACGANDALYVFNAGEKHISKDIEAHALFNRNQNQFVNTTAGDNVPYVVDTITVDKSFSFLDEETRPYIFDKTKGYAVYVATKGQDPHAIMVPYDFRWPLERICVKDAYKSFNNWATNEITDTDWYKFPELDKVY